MSQETRQSQVRLLQVPLPFAQRPHRRLCACIGIMDRSGRGLASTADRDEALPQLRSIPTAKLVLEQLETTYRMKSPLSKHLGRCSKEHFKAYVEYVHANGLQGGPGVESKGKRKVCVVCLGAVWIVVGITSGRWSIGGGRCCQVLPL